ncbi:P-loop containing nucleoside triphosphate hydrolase protein, partial [Lactarius hatsudake]
VSLTHPEVYLHTGVQPSRGVLLHGTSGCGKTLLSNAIGGVRNGGVRNPTFFFLATNALWIQEFGLPFIYIGATNRPDALDPALRQAGHFDREIGMTVPDDEARAQCVWSGGYHCRETDFQKHFGSDDRSR